MIYILSELECTFTQSFLLQPGNVTVDSLQTSCVFIQEFKTIIFFFIWPTDFCKRRSEFTKQARWALEEFPMTSLLMGPQEAWEQNPLCRNTHTNMRRYDLITQSFTLLPPIPTKVLLSDTLTPFLLICGPYTPNIHTQFLFSLTFLWRSKRAFNKITASIVLIDFTFSWNAFRPSPLVLQRSTRSLTLVMGNL